ncbi:sigma-70 family RNA polymerase sigma factor [Pseudoduganella sp. R-34]|uniref:sigma-70 family RNA polymerase sigma factor n=1 Tax=Pseudoduganella sp. R-34 TaxID=3404062 RepID=UPI003CEF8959
MPTDHSDDELMLRYRDGELSAFQELYRRHSRGLYRFLAWRSGRTEWADEVAQETWLAVHHARSRYAAQGSFRSYLFQIGRNRLADMQRQPDIDDGGDICLVQDSAEATALDRQQNLALHAAIRQLPSEQKEALVLQHFSGLSIDEIALVVAAPAETVKSRLRYAMRKLREQFKQEETV